MLAVQTERAYRRGRAVNKRRLALDLRGHADVTARVRSAISDPTRFRWDASDGRVISDPAWFAVHEPASRLTSAAPYSRADPGRSVRSTVGLQQATRLRGHREPNLLAALRSQNAYRPSFPPPIYYVADASLRLHLSCLTFSDLALSIGARGDHLEMGAPQGQLQVASRKLEDDNLPPSTVGRSQDRPVPAPKRRMSRPDARCSLPSPTWQQCVRRERPASMRAPSMWCDYCDPWNAAKGGSRAGARNDEPSILA
jgi:hypothetical protein